MYLLVLILLSPARLFAKTGLAVAKMSLFYKGLCFEIFSPSVFEAKAAVVADGPFGLLSFLDADDVNCPTIIFA